VPVNRKVKKPEEQVPALPGDRTPLGILVPLAAQSGTAAVGQRKPGSLDPRPPIPHLSELLLGTWPGQAEYRENWF